MIEQIVAAAIEHDGLVYSVPRPQRHHDIIRGFSKICEPGVISATNQGFLTSEGRFVDRHEALKIALEAEQPFTDFLVYNCELYSENLW